MPPKRSKKRKAAPNNSVATNGEAAAAPDRATWPGWVEMESEPAFFNVMLSEMGVQGVRVQEVYGIEDDMLAILPQPVHALIFLFRYIEPEYDEDQLEGCPEQVWFANQVPDFACASYALLNIVNNISGLELGDELRKFKEFTKDMDSFDRGNAVESFDFVRRIHNSFAREGDLLQADQHAKEKAIRAKKRRALAKARETREANKAAKAVTPSKKSLESTKPKAERSSQRKKEFAKANSDGEYETPSKTKRKSEAHDSKQPSDEKASSSDLSDPPENLEDLKPVNVRRSARAPQPRKDITNYADAEEQEERNEDGFHFIAYMPIDGHVWKLDGLDKYPEDMGPIVDGIEWIHIAQPALEGRMAQFEGAELEFNLMAVVHDPLISDRAALASNAKTIQTFDERLNEVYEDWREMENAETKKDVIVEADLSLGITPADVMKATTSATDTAGIDQEEDLLKLIERRAQVIKDQAPLRASVRDSLESTRSDEEKARHRRHDYRTFIRSWLGALAENDALADVLAAG